MALLDYTVCFTVGEILRYIAILVVYQGLFFLISRWPEPFAAVYDIPEATRHVSSELTFGEIKTFLQSNAPWEYEIVQEDEAKKQLVILTTATRFSPRSRCFLSIQERGEGVFQISIHKRYKYTPPRLDILDQFAALFEGAKV